MQVQKLFQLAAGTVVGTAVLTSGRAFSENFPDPDTGPYICSGSCERTGASTGQSQTAVPVIDLTPLVREGAYAFATDLDTMSGPGSIIVIR